ncbi:MAG TPA: choice-of-anchor tandem repeat GloVer-containing protein [Candidatus Cybelea sp.]
MLASCSRGFASPPLPSSATYFDSATSLAGNGYKVIFRFGGKATGASPGAGPIELTGTLYGETSAGGANNHGTVFSLTTAGKERVLHSFKGGSDGAAPGYGSLIDVGGTLYGTTQNGGDSKNNGTVFKITTAGVEKTLYRFKGGKDGANPIAALVAVSGKLYGTTQNGGSSGNGTVFSIATSGVEKVLYSFKGGSDGANPTARLTDVSGTLYGTTKNGGGGCSTGCGTVFSVSTTGSEDVLHAFRGAPSDGATPTGGLTDVNGTLYGTTQYAGKVQSNVPYGTVFKITTSGQEKLLHTFIYRDGENPSYGNLTDVSGTLYGSTPNGGPNGFGVVFKISTSGAEKILYSFKAGKDGANPYAGPVAMSGKLYGTTQAGGGPASAGTAFTILP